jgi:hypothetical protein
VWGYGKLLSQRRVDHNHQQSRLVVSAFDGKSALDHARALNPCFLRTRFFRFVTLDFCLGSSLRIVQEVKTTAVPVWAQWAHR